MPNTSIGKRMINNYESRVQHQLTRRIPVIIRVDGRAFHTLTRQCKKPFDQDFSNIMTATALYLCENIQGTKCAYKQSDEISILVTDFNRLTSDAWFDYNIQKLASISAGLASSVFTIHWNETFDEQRVITFDARSFNIPEKEVYNYFVWRQRDWNRNSLQMLARSVYCHKQLQNKNQADMHEMLYEKDINWASLDPEWKNGIFIHKQLDGQWIFEPAPTFEKERYSINDLLIPEES